MNSLLKRNKNKKGVVLTEMIASVILLGIASSMLIGVMFFVYNTYNITMRVGKQNETSLIITQSILNNINEWKPQNLDDTQLTNDKIVTLYRYEYFTNVDVNGSNLELRRKLLETDPDKLVIQLTQDANGNAQLEYVFTPGTDADTSVTINRDSYSMQTYLNDFKLDYDNSKINKITLTRDPSSDVVKSYLVEIYLKTISPIETEIIVTIPVIINIE